MLLAEAVIVSDARLVLKRVLLRMPVRDLPRALCCCSALNHQRNAPFDVASRRSRAPGGLKLKSMLLACAQSKTGWWRQHGVEYGLNRTEKALRERTG